MARAPEAGDTHTAPPADETFDVPVNTLVRRRKTYSRKSRSISYRRTLTKDERVELAVIEDEIGPYARPTNRAECRNGPCPCPFVSCRHHLYLEVEWTGTIKLNHPDLEVDEIKETCSLDVADRDAATLDEVGELLNITRERTRQIELKGQQRLKKAVKLRGWTPKDLLGEQARDFEEERDMHVVGSGDE